MSHFPKPFYRKSRKLWYVQIDGRQHNLGPDRDRAFESYHELMRRPRTNVTVVGDSVLKIIDAYLEWCQQHRAPETYEWYRFRLQSFALTLPRNLTADRLKPHHVQSWIDSQSHWSNGSKRNGCKAVQRTMRWAWQQGYIDQSPIAHMEKPPMGKREVVLSEEQFAAVKAEIPDNCLLDLLNVTWFCGCRPQESLRVEARHVDPRGCRWIIPVSESKTDIVRVVYLPEEAMAISAVMSSSKFLSIKEAAEMAGVSKKTVERRYKRHLKSLGLTIATAPNLVRQEIRSGRPAYLLAEDFVRQLTPQAKPAPDKTQGATEARLFEQLQEKDQQLKRKDEQINGLQALIDQEQRLHLQTQQQRRPLLRLGRNTVGESTTHTPARQGSLVGVNWFQIVAVSLSVFVVGLLSWLFHVTG